jgi:hypothetical protein
MALTVQSEKKKMEALGDMPDTRKKGVPPIVSVMKLSTGCPYKAPKE